MPEGYFNSNSHGRAEEMTKFDPKLVKKIVHSKLIACATEVGVKNADKVSKEILIPAYLDAVEKAEGEGVTLSPGIVNMYNEIVTTLELNKEEEAPPEAAPETPAAPAPAPVPLARKAGSPVPPKAPAPLAAPKAEKPPKERKAPTAPAPKGYNRWTALGEALVQMKSGKVDDLFVLSNKIYVELGGKDNVKEAAAVGKGGFSLLEKAQVITITGDSFSRK
jgi:hypothetical protein